MGTFQKKTRVCLFLLVKTLHLLIHLSWSASKISISKNGYRCLGIFVCRKIVLRSWVKENVNIWKEITEGVSTTASIVPQTYCVEVQHALQCKWASLQMVDPSADHCFESAESNLVFFSNIFRSFIDAVTWERESAPINLRGVAVPKIPESAPFSY